MLWKIEGCPRPLSRKKARQLMWRNRADFRSYGLAYRYGRKPGRGRSRGRLESEQMQLEKAMERARNEKKSAARIAQFETALKRIGDILSPRKMLNRAMRARANS